MTVKTIKRCCMQRQRHEV